jgi:hypothetical protein
MTLSLIGNTVLSIGSYGILGAVGAKAAEVVSKKVGSLNPLKIVSAAMPQWVQDSLKKGTFSQLMATCNIKIGDIFQNPKMSSVIGAPFFEEAVFRAGIQQVLTLGLSYGMEITYAEAASILITNILFSMAHGKDIDSQAGTELWMKGTAFSFAYSQGGYAAAMVAHFINNVRQNYGSKIATILKGDDDSTSNSDNFATMLAKAKAEAASKKAQAVETVEAVQAVHPIRDANVTA